MKYRVSAVARATGVPASTLRTWERRYGIPAPNRSGRGQRLYDEEDLALIRRMAALIESGIGAAQAADSARAGDGVPVQAPTPGPTPDPLVDELFRGTTRFDERAIEETLTRTVTNLGWAATLEQVIFPTLRRIGRQWEEGSLDPSQEHFLSALLRRTLLAAIAGLPRTDAPPRVILALPDDEQHEFGALALSLLLTQRQVPVAYLGAGLPVSSLQAAVTQIGANIVCFSATSPASLPAVGLAIRELARGRHAPKVFVGGPALQSEAAVSLPGIRLPQSISAAAQVLAEAAEQVA